MYTFSVSELMIETKMIVIKNNKDQIDYYQNVMTNIVFSTFFLIKKNEKFQCLASWKRTKF